MRPRRISIALILSFLLSSSAFGGEWREVSPGDVVRLPEDLYFQDDYRVQWWYLTGHVRDSSGREFGYQVTFFAAGVQHRKYESEFGVDFLYLSHFAVSDVQQDRFYHFGTMDGGAYGFAGANRERLRVWVGDDSLEGSMREMRVRARGGKVALDLFLVPQKPVVLHGDRGYSRKSLAFPPAASLYFSFPQLRTAGTLRLGESVFTVSGSSWFDRELFSKWPDSVAGWDWFSIKLDDDRELMLYRIRSRDKQAEPYSSGTVVYRDGSYRHLEGKDFSVKAVDHYTSDHTGARYPSKWEVTVPSEGLKLLITPLVQDQEFTEARAIRNVYWEGTNRVEGTVSGRAYVEMTGYK